MTRKKLLIFDVNETLLDINILSDFFESRFGNKRFLRQWFSELILYSQALTLSDQYINFEILTGSVLEMLARADNIDLSQNDLEDFQSKLKKMEAHPDVIPALKLLKEEGFRLFALTNSSEKGGIASLENAGLINFFERIISVEEVGKFKPAQEVYQYACDLLDSKPQDMRLIACHTWDIIGARAAGYDVALLTRKGNAPLSIAGQADIVADDLVKIVREIMIVDK